ncbi:hypothetical protein PR202_gb17135 [Eleusine coracana subsp. coracana]|uniref:SCP domain-containing protein n=1 Tax=Eleusine coracana subsp. coracana TaxID=191504 RepID=A0AAV5F277_ELECO|nr:hypothetical protein PR202_gb17135 [Eleusine coracana subsp. coracana]
MALAKSAFALAIAMAILAATTSAQNAPQDFVDLHNEERTAAGVGPVSWDAEVANYSQSYAELRASTDCTLKISNGSYGENLYWGSPGRAWTAANAVRRWVGQKGVLSLRDQHLRSWRQVRRLHAGGVEEHHAHRLRSRSLRPGHPRWCVHHLQLRPPREF